jgi:hypothetical protein
MPVAKFACQLIRRMSSLHYTEYVASTSISILTAAQILFGVAGIVRENGKLCIRLYDHHVTVFFYNTYMYYEIRKTYKDVYEHICTRRIQAQLSQPSYTKAPVKNKNYNEDLGACVFQEHQKTPSTTAVEPTPTAVVEEEAMATPYLE